MYLQIKKKKKNMLCLFHIKNYFKFFPLFLLYILELLFTLFSE